MDVVRIEKDAFLNCSSLRSIVIPASVNDIVPSAGCTSLENISVSEANTAFASRDGVLMSRDGKSILWFPMGKRGEYSLPATVTAIGAYAFRDCSIEKFVFPAGLAKIGECAFYNSKVKEVVLPSTLKLLPTGVFQKCASLKTVRLGDDVELLSDRVFDGSSACRSLHQRPYAASMQPQYVYHNRHRLYQDLPSACSDGQEEILSCQF